MLLEVLIPGRALVLVGLVGVVVSPRPRLRLPAILAVGLSPRSLPLMPATVMVLMSPLGRPVVPIGMKIPMSPVIRPVIAVMVKLLMPPPGRLVMPVVVEILVIPSPRAMLPVMPGRMVTPGLVPIPRLDRRRQQKNRSECTAYDGSFHSSPPHGNFVCIYLVRRERGESVNRGRFFVGNQRSAEAFGFLMLTLKKCCDNEDQTSTEVSP